jgi:hypothetical protein
MKACWLVTSLLTVVLAIAVLLAAPATASPQGNNGIESSDTWGGMHVSMEISAQGATLEFDCARGEILEVIKPNAKGEFSVRGTYTPEHGGPIRKDNPPRDLPAVYKGSIQGSTMQLEIVMADKDQAPEPLTLTRGQVGRVMKCR